MADQAGCLREREIETPEVVNGCRVGIKLHGLGVERRLGARRNVALRKGAEVPDVPCPLLSCPPGFARGLGDPCLEILRELLQPLLTFDQESLGALPNSVGLGPVTGPSRA